MKLEVNGIEADVSNSVIAINRTAINLENLSLRQIDFTNRFKLPKSNVNKQIFGSPQIMNSNNNGFDLLYDAKLIDQFFLFNGKGKLTEFDKKYFSFQLIEASREFFDDLNKPIYDLDFEDDDFTYNSANFTALNTPGTSVFVWPLISMHEDKSSAKLTRTYVRPCFLFKIILNKIFTSRDWTLEYDEDFIDSIGLSSNHKTFKVTSYQKTINTTYSVGGTDNIDNLDTNDFEHGVTTASETIDISDTSTAFRFRGLITTDADMTITIKGTASPSGDIKQEVIQLFEGINNIDFTSDKFSTDDANHSIEFIISGTGDIIFTDCLLYTIIEEEDFADLSTNPLDDYRVKAYDNLPNLNQIDIFRAAIIWTNSIIVPDSLNKKIELKTLKFQSLLNSKDWSEKYSSHSEKVKNYYSSYGQVNYLEYDNDETISYILGRGQFEINNEGLKDTNTLITMPFSASRDIEISSKTLAEFFIYEDTQRIEDNDLNRRVVYIYQSGSYYGRFTDLDFTTIISQYYKDLFDSMKRLRLVNCEMNLNKLDVLGYDFRELVYIAYFKSYFIVLSIDDFIPNKLTNVKLLKYL